MGRPRERYRRNCWLSMPGRKPLIALPERRGGSPLFRLYSVLPPVRNDLALPAPDLKVALHFPFMQDSFLPGGYSKHDLNFAVPRLHDIPQLQEFTARLTPGAGLQPLHCPRTEADWRKLIEAQDIVCATTREGRLAGFYATNHFDLLDFEKERPQVRAAHNVLCNRYRLPNQKVSFGAQAVADVTPQNVDLRSQLLRELLRSVGLRYRYLFTVVDKENSAEMRCLSAEGWRCFHEEDEACYMMLDVARALRSLATHLILHFPDRPAKRTAGATSA